MTRKLTAKDRIMNLLRKGTPMLSMEMAAILNIPKGVASEAAKELHAAKLIHIVAWRHNAKNGGNKVYAFGEGEDVVKPEPRYVPKNRIEQQSDVKSFVPHADVAAAWMMNKIERDAVELL